MGPAQSDSEQNFLRRSNWLGTTGTPCGDVWLENIFRGIIYLPPVNPGQSYPQVNFP
uniref:Uncharacterized protein n=1 Tax=Candidatus Nitrotoga fabula TaxID=2182327 RepID=A0A2X0QRS0_9PROT|nr:protein of unknown function [Candidatus Nitrotoga fabula]